MINNHPTILVGCYLTREKKVSKLPNMVNLASTVHKRCARLDNKPKQKHGLFDKLLLSITGFFEVAKNPHIFLTRPKQHIQGIDGNFDETLNHDGLMVFAKIKKQMNYRIRSTCCCNQTSQISLYPWLKILKQAKPIFIGHL